MSTLAVTPIDLKNHPKGTWLGDHGGGTVIGAAHRDLSAGLAALFFGLIWNSLLAVFVAFAVSATLPQLHISPPAWFPVSTSGEDPWDVTMTIYLWLFLAPFIFIGLFFVGWFLASLFGRTEVRVLNAEGTIFVGFRRFGYTRRFDASRVRQVLFRRERNTEGGDTFTVLMLTSEGGRIKFGSMLSEERCRFMAAAVRKTVVR